MANMAEIQSDSGASSACVSKNLCKKCLLGEFLTEEPNALIGHVGFCEGLLRLFPHYFERRDVETESTRRKMKTFEGLNVQTKRSKRRTVSIQVLKEQNDQIVLFVKMPEFIDHDQLQTILESKRSWIMKSKDKLLSYET